MVQDDAFYFDTEYTCRTPKDSPAVPARFVCFYFWLFGLFVCLIGRLFVCVFVCVFVCLFVCLSKMESQTVYKL